MKKEITLALLNEVIQLLKENSYLADKYDSPIIEIVYKDYRKRFSDFYRLKIHNQNNAHLWVKILKNKSHSEIKETLTRQFLLFNCFYEYLHNRKSITSSYNYACCNPIDLFINQNAIVTLECKGMRFDKFLKKSIPFFNSEKILDYSYHIGTLLRKFHDCFADNPILSETSLEKQELHFIKHFKKPPHKKFNYLTICHNDFSPRNVFVSEKNVEVIDFVALEPGFPQEDLLFFTKYILNARINFLYSTNFKTLMTECFLKGYGIEDNSIVFDLL